MNDEKKVTLKVFKIVKHLWVLKFHKKSRMHSSRMRTTRLLPESPSMHCSRGGVSAPGGCLLLGWSARGGVCCWGCLLQAGCVLLGVSAPGNVCSGGVSARGVVSQHALRQTPPVNRITDTCKNITSWAVIMHSRLFSRLILFLRNFNPSMFHVIQVGHA